MAAPLTTDDAVSLPGWIYRDPDFFEVERQAIFRSSWQIVCHVNDIPAPGDYHTFRFLGESVAVVRGRDGRIHAFHNVCRHRAARLLDGDKGRCGGRIVCPYHAWSYDLDGTLVGVPHRRGFPEFQLADYPLPPVEHEVFLGFIFIRLAPGPGPSVAEMMAPYRQELTPYRFEALQPLGRVTWRPRAVNWKNVGDNYSDALHITVAHPGLTRLFGAGYGLESQPWVDKMWGALVDTPSPARSERFYQKYLPDVGHLPAERKRLWTYFKLWPNIAFDIYPDQIDFMQWLPLSPTETLVREIAYVLPDDRREMRAVRYANWRINRQVSLEDKALIERVQDGMDGSSYTTGPLGLNEVSLRGFARRVRALIPESRLPHAPAPGWSLRRPT
ncbi:aromatic ring-hydroxylating oxygenase subunit alpha [Nitrospirillum iridis]|uniref:Phenylpropionate dioxygenase-like ring-hydroxylating dioxygenase large terminal subunit n=1 Tax=Nitrospirillum iridis TaxID=765888 RepID=A0A7X0EBK9_9PROT|nr:aromatic ring-hydroxylating dioxygenase subunit alpha [Nitrospirillum iridis]MBB6250782.1 phenylpropionate dioxygenase-like ring-hydroxylating dioxygenase large terminal subunit [Nitrospirillum iridis]